jgi:predicted  nucleic acid-binding Zn-ribbon protein
MDQQEKLKEIQKRLEELANQIARLTETLRVLREQIERQKDAAGNSD